MSELIGAIKELLELAVGYDATLKTVATILSILLAVVSFCLSQRARWELTRYALKNGLIREKAIAAQKAAADAERKLANERAQVIAQKQKIDALQHDIELLTARADEMWKVSDRQAFPEYRDWKRHEKCAKFVSFGNLKGGVGKTTLTANYAAYLSTKLKKRVLVVDLDYQGSLSNMLLQGLGEDTSESRADVLLGPDVSYPMIQHSMIDLQAYMPKVQLVPASYPLNKTENKLLFEAFLREQQGTDVRYRLSHALLREEVGRYFDVVLFDLPPRMSLAMINALVASHFLVIPSRLDRLSSVAVAQFQAIMERIADEMSLELEVAGVIGSMTKTRTRSPDESRIWDELGTVSKEWKGRGRDLRLEPTVPTWKAIGSPDPAAVGYFARHSDGTPVSQLFDPLFDELSARIGLISGSA